MSAPPPRLELHGVSKTFGRQRVLNDVKLRVMPGELHGVVGQNGSGKSTLAKILTGYHAPDPGAEVRIDGARLRLPIRLRQARDLGLAVVHQTLGLFDEATVLENIRVGRFRAGRWTRRIRWDAERDAAAEVLAALGRPVRLDARAGTLSAEDRATVAIARALQQARDGRGVVIFDESTRALSRESQRHFYDLVEGVLTTGTAVLLISHRLDEVLQVTDAITVLRDGEVVRSGPRPADLDHATLVHAMLGRTADAQREHAASTTAQATVPARGDGDTGAVPGVGAGASTGAGADDPAADADTGVRPAAKAGERVAARIAGVTGDVVRSFALDVGRGEIVGVTGLVGSGYEELPYLLAGARTAVAGSLTVGGTTLDLARRDCAAALAAGVALVPEDRDSGGLAGGMSVAENITLPQVRARGSAVRLNRRWEDEEVQALLERLDVRPFAPGMPVGALSGGNRQKVLLAKWLATRPELLVLHEPTQAVDVGARLDLIAAIRSAAGRGCGAIIAGGDEDELAALCDRVIVLDHGRIHHVLNAPLSPSAISEVTHDQAERPLRAARRWSVEAP